MDHFDFRGSTFNEPFVAKKVTQVTQTVTTVARPDDKHYVVLKSWSDFQGSENEHGYYRTTVDVEGVASTKERANDRVRSMTFTDYTLVHEAISESDGTLYRHFENIHCEEDTLAVYVEVVDAI